MGDLSQGTRKKSTYVRYSGALEAFLSAFPKKEQIYDFSRQDVHDYMQKRLEKGVKPNSVNFELVVIRSFWKFLVIVLSSEMPIYNIAKYVNRVRA